MMEEENKNQHTTRLRNMAASTIQCWWRYHLATNWKPPHRYAYFTHVCYKLYITEERINQNRALANKLREKLEKFENFQLFGITIYISRRRPTKKKSLTHQGSVTAEILKFGFKGMVKPVLERQDSVDRLERKVSLRRTVRKRLHADKITLPFQRSEDRRSSLPDALAVVDPAIVSKKVLLIFKKCIFVAAQASSLCWSTQQLCRHINVIFLWCFRAGDSVWNQKLPWAERGWSQL